MDIGERVLVTSEQLGLQPNFFEITFAMASDYFQSQQCDMVVLETGMGGRLDPTNICEPVAT